MAGCTVYKRMKEQSKKQGKRQGHASQTIGAGRSEAEEKVGQRGVQQTSEWLQDFSFKMEGCKKSEGKGEGKISNPCGAEWLIDMA